MRNRNWYIQEVGPGCTQRCCLACIRQQTGSPERFEAIGADREVGPAEHEEQKLVHPGNLRHQRRGTVRGTRLALQLFEERQELNSPYFILENVAFPQFSTTSISPIVLFF